jgi:two-component system NarL family sensor kinase
MNRNIFLINFLIAIFLLVSCKKENHKNDLYVKPNEERLDATCLWLKEEKNYKSPDYSKNFNTYYDAKIKTKNFNDAAKALEIVAELKISNLSFDEDFSKKINDFAAKYKEKIKKNKTTFLYSYIANYYSDKGEYQKAIDNYLKITSVKANDYYSCNNLGDAFYNIGYCNNAMGKQELALQNNYKALECFKKTNYNIGLGKVYGNFGGIYIFTHQFKKAEQNINKSIEYYQKEKDIDNTYMSLHNKIVLFDVKKDKRFYSLIDSVYHSYVKSKSSNSVLKIILTTFYIQKLVDEGDFKQAKQKLEEIKPIALMLNSKSSLEDYSAALAYYEIKNNKGISDISTYTKAIPIFIENENYQNLEIVYSLLKEDALSKNNFKNALFYSEKKQIASENLANEAIKTKVIDIDTKYKTKQKEQQITLKELSIEKNKKIIAILATILSTLILAIISVVFWQSKKKLIKEKTLKTMFAKELLQNTENERKRIANDLHDGISHELLSLKSVTIENFLGLNSKIDVIINEIRQISRNLHPAMFDRVGLEFSIKQLIDYLELKNQFMITYDIDYNKKLSPENELQLYRIVQESLSNIIKYADAHSASVSLKEVNNFLILEIKDNGKGFNVEEKLNNKTSFGLHSLIERGNVVGGKTTIFSDSLGTVITLKIPMQCKQ